MSCYMSFIYCHIVCLLLPQTVCFLWRERARGRRYESLLVYGQTFTCTYIILYAFTWIVQSSQQEQLILAWGKDTTHTQRGRYSTGETAGRYNNEKTHSFWSSISDSSCIENDSVSLISIVSQCVTHKSHVKNWDVTIVRCPSMCRC